MNTTTATTPTIADSVERGSDVTVVLTDGTELTGTFVSVNSKGVNINVDGKLITRALSRVASVAEITEVDETELEAEDASTEGLTTAELADMFEVSARALRVRLRKLGMGVGKGRRYYLTDDELATVRASVEGAPIEE